MLHLSGARQTKQYFKFYVVATLTKPIRFFVFLGEFLLRVGSWLSFLERSLLECFGKREGGDTGSSTAMGNYCGSCCIVTILNRLRLRWARPQRLAKSRARAAVDRRGTGSLMSEKDLVKYTLCEIK